MMVFIATNVPVFPRDMPKKAFAINDGLLSWIFCHMMNTCYEYGFSEGIVRCHRIPDYSCVFASFYSGSCTLI